MVQRWSRLLNTQKVSNSSLDTIKERLRQNNVCLIKIKSMHFISSQSNIWYEITARRTNLKVLWRSGYDVCLTRRRSPVQAWTASRQVFDKMLFFYLIKTKIKHFISNQSNIWYEITARKTNRKMPWCSGNKVCVARRTSPVQSRTASRKGCNKTMSLLDKN